MKLVIFGFSGFLLGTRQTILETKDGGSTWAPRSISSAEEEDFNYRFNSISFKGKEGWIVGKPAILLYTSDAGENWKRVPLSSQLPGDIVSLISFLQFLTKYVVYHKKCVFHVGSIGIFFYFNIMKWIYFVSARNKLFERLE